MLLKHGNKAIWSDNVPGISRPTRIHTHTHTPEQSVDEKKKIPTDFSCNLISRVKVFHHDIYSWLQVNFRKGKKSLLEM